MKMHPERIEMVKKQYPVGTRIQLDSLCNDERGMPSGLCGTVVGVDDQPALLMKWDNGRSLSLMPFADNFTVIPQEQEPTTDEQLYDKLRREQQSYTRELLTLPPSKILEKAWEYLVREDILLTMEYKTLEDEQAQVLLDLPDTMTVLCDAVKDQDTRHQDTIIHEIEKKANELAMEQPSQPEQTM